MKKCSLCQKVYDDDTLNFCLNDGTTLIDSEDLDKTIEMTLIDRGNGLQNFALSKTADIEKHSKTLRDHFETDFPEYLSISKHVVINKNTYPKDAVEVQTKLVQDYTAASEFIVFYIPEYAFTAEACISLIEICQLVLDKKDAPAIEHGLIGEQKTNINELRFTGRIFIYHESIILKHELERISAVYGKKDLLLILRNRDYVYLSRKAAEKTNTL